MRHTRTAAFHVPRNPWLASTLLVLALTHAPGASAQRGAGPGGPPPGASAAADAPAEPVGGPAPLDRLQLALDLQPGQQPAWQAYTARLDAYLQLYYRERPAQASDTGPRQLARLVDLQQNRLAALEDIEAAVRALYAVLTPAQQTEADRLLLATLPPGVAGVPASGATESRSQGGGPRSGRGGGMPPGGGGF